MNLLVATGYYHICHFVPWGCKVFRVFILINMCMDLTKRLSVIFMSYVQARVCVSKMGTPGVKWVQLFLKYLHLWSPVSCAIHCQDGSKEID